MTFPPITALPLLQAVAGHHHPVPFYVTRDMFGGLPFQIAGGEISDKVGKPVAELHTHDVDEIYLLLSPNARGACIEIVAGGEAVVLESPAVYHVPAGVKHRFLTLRAEPGSYCLGVLLANPR